MIACGDKKKERLLLRPLSTSLSLSFVALESKACSGYYRRHLLQFGAATSVGPIKPADLNRDATIAALAWVVRHFVPMVVGDRKKFCESMLANTPLVQCMSTGDLAFAILVLEHHMMKWRRLIHFRLETGESPSEEARRQTGGLLHSGGIDGKDAKSRFGSLCVYFNAHFRDGERTVTRLQTAVNALVRKEANHIRIDIRNCGTVVDRTIMEIQNDILHRVFCYTHL